MKKIRRPATEEPKLQFAVLPWRRAAKLEIMLVSSRETGRWVLPKGWPIKGIKPHETAAQEALEEAGILGKVAKTPLGDYCSRKNKGMAPYKCVRYRSSSSRSNGSASPG